MLYGTIQIKGKVLRFRSGWKNLILKPRIKKVGNDLIYKDKSFPIEMATYKPLVISYQPTDISFESLRKTEIRNCKILSKYMISDQQNQNYYLDLDMNPYPIVDMVKPSIISSSRITFIIGEEFIKINRRGANNYGIELPKNSNLDEGICLNRFEKMFKKEICLWSMTITDAIKEDWPVMRKAWLNKQNFKRFKKFIEFVNPTLHNELDDIVTMDVLDINELDDIMKREDLMEYKSENFSNCEIWEIQKNNIIVEKNIILSEYKIDGDKNKYLILKNCNFEKLQKELVVGEFGFKSLYLIQINKNSLENFINRNFIKRISGDHNERKSDCIV